MLMVEFVCSYLYFFDIDGWLCVGFFCYNLVLLNENVIFLMKKVFLMICDVVVEVGVLVVMVLKYVNGMQCFLLIVEVWFKEVIEWFGYCLNLFVCLMIIGCMCMIGFVIFDISNLYFMNVVKGVNCVVLQYDYMLLFVDIEESQVCECLLIEVFVQCVDGLIVSMWMFDEEVGWMFDFNKLFVLLCCSLGLLILSVGIDNWLLMYMFVCYLFNFGYMCIVYFGFGIVCVNDEWIQGVCDCFVEVGFMLDVYDVYVLIVEVGECVCLCVMFGLQCLQVVICYNDLIVFGFMKEVVLFGFWLLQDVFVVGVDNVLYGEYVVFVLMIVDIQSENMGEFVMQKLIDVFVGCIDVSYLMFELWLIMCVLMVLVG